VILRIRRHFKLAVLKPTYFTYFACLLPFAPAGLRFNQNARALQIEINNHVALNRNQRFDVQPSGLKLNSIPNVSSRYG